MSTTFSAKVNLSIIFQEVMSGILFTNSNVSKALTEQLDLTPGTADGSINVAWAKTEVGIGASVTTVYDLIGVLRDTEGNLLNFDEVVLIAVRNRSSTAANVLLVGPDVSNGHGVLGANVGFWNDASDRNIVPADGGSWFVLHCRGGVPAVAATSDEIAVITLGGTSANTWDILILGRDN